MTENKLNLTYKQFIAYVLLYAAHIDLKVTDDERQLIASKVGKNDFHLVKKEFDAKSDYERIQCIVSYKSKYFNNKEDINKLQAEINVLLKADGKISAVENAVFNLLKKIL